MPQWPKCHLFRPHIFTPGHSKAAIGPFHREISTGPPRCKIIDILQYHPPDSFALICSQTGRRLSYGGLLAHVAAARSRLSGIPRERENSKDSWRDSPVSFLATDSIDYVINLLSIIGSGGIALPLPPFFPVSELRFLLEQSRSQLLLTDDTRDGKADELTNGLSISTAGIYSSSNVNLSQMESVEMADSSEDGGLLLYTSGTTSRPKGVLLKSENLIAQARSLIQSWDISADDVVLNSLPLHHIHGVVNALLTPLIAGSTIEFLRPFNARAIWNRLAMPFISNSRQNHHIKPISFFSAVPTMYHRLLAAYNDLDAQASTAAKLAIQPHTLRLNISGSAALPSPLKHRWDDLSGGNTLLERYGMTEAGMALSCGLHMKNRIDGSVGWPMPSVQVRLVDDQGHVVGDEGGLEGNKTVEGEIQLRGPTIFQEYWHDRDATRTAFCTSDGSDSGHAWFKTGDIASRSMASEARQLDQYWTRGPCYFIKGRRSADIIKSGGEKISALEVEREMLAMPEIEEVAVIGKPSEQWGQKVFAIVVLGDRASSSLAQTSCLTLRGLRSALKDRLPPFALPQDLKIVPKLARNSMGKVNKRELAREHGFG